MHFSSAVIIPLLLYHRVSFSECSFLGEITFSKEEDILGRFFAEIKLFLDEVDTWHLTIVGASDDQLYQVKSLLKAFPYFVGRDAKKFCISREFSPRSLVIYFLASLDEKYITKVLESLFHCKKNRIYFISEGISVKDVDIELVLRLAVKKISRRPVFVHHNAKSLKLYGYTITRDCAREVELLVDWMPGVDMKKLEYWYNDFRYKGCSIPIGAIHRPPSMNLAEDATGTARIIGGSEGDMISTIAQKLNFTMLVRNFGLLVKVGSNPALDMISSCAAENISIGIAKIRPTRHLNEMVETSQSYASECLVWAIPRIRHQKREIVTFEFSWRTWLLIALTFLTCFGVEKIARNTDFLNRANAKNSKSRSIILDLVGSTLGNPIVYQPISMGGKLLLIMYLCYSTVITTAYKTSLSAILTVENSESPIVDVAGILEANFTTGGDHFGLNILQDQINEYESVPRLIERYVIEPNVSKALRQISHDKNLAYLTSLSNLIYHKDVLAQSGEHVSFDILDQCVLNYASVMIFPKSSHSASRLNHIIARLAESGLLNFWKDTSLRLNRMDPRSPRSSDEKNTEEGFHSLTRDKFYYIFQMYFLALTFCTLVFFGEIIVHKLQIAGKGRKIKNLKRFKIGRCKLVQFTQNL